MESKDVQTVFDNVLFLPKGKKAILIFETERAAECARVQLYQEKRKYFKRNSSDTEELTFSRRYDPEKGTFQVVVEKISRGFSFYLEDEQGNLIKQELKDESTSPEPEPEPICTIEEEKED